MAGSNFTQDGSYIHHVDDIAAHLRACSDAFGHLNGILRAIAQHSAASSDVANLAGAGIYIASDMENLTDGWGTDVEAMGVRHG